VGTTKTFDQTRRNFPWKWIKEAYANKLKGKGNESDHMSADTAFKKLGIIGNPLPDKEKFRGLPAGDQAATRSGNLERSTFSAIGKGEERSGNIAKHSERGSRGLARKLGSVD